MFQYLVDKIASGAFESEPFRHIQINDFLSADHFEEIVATDEISTPAFQSDEQMFEALFALGYKIIDFPGCITDYKEYIRWHSDRRGQLRNNSSCEGFGVTLRLMAPAAPILIALTKFLESDDFQSALRSKFSIDHRSVYYDAGIQKYLDGYEISPHPDTRQKALTYMVNINPRSDSEQCDHHTHYLRFTPERRYIHTLWEHNPRADRCWVPWDWCESIKTQPKNNSVVIFAPSNDTVHAVKAAYDHLAGQRTQLYGNLWFKDAAFDLKPEWEDLDFTRPAKARKAKPQSLIRRIANRLSPEDDNIVSNRRAGK